MPAGQPAVGGIKLGLEFFLAHGAPGVRYAFPAPVRATGVGFFLDLIAVPARCPECLAIPGWVPYIRADMTVSNADDGGSGAAGRREAGVSAWEARS